MLIDIENRLQQATYIFFFYFYLHDHDHNILVKLITVIRNNIY